MKKNGQLAREEVTRFCDLIRAGIEMWVEAGALLVEMRKRDPEVHLRIMERNPMMTLEVLDAFERIGNRQIYPYLIVDASPGARLLAGLPYEQQQSLYGGKVDVVIKTADGLRTVRKKIADLTAAEASRAFDLCGLRPVDEQKKLFRAKPASPRDSYGGTVRREAKEAATIVEFPSNEEGVLDASKPPKARIHDFLKIAQDAVLNVRTVISEAKLANARDLDDRLTLILTHIGKVRLEACE
jgi:hypothetical protein